MPNGHGLLLLNVGSPDNPSESAIRRYLKQFLMDPYVLDIPWALRWLLVNGVILRNRPKHSAEAYASIWTEQGSPLITISQDFATALRSQLNCPVEIGMAYGSPSVSDGVTRLKTAGADHITVLPMFPHYAMSTTEGLVACFKKVIKKNPTPYSVISPFYNHPDYIQVLAKSIKSRLTPDTHLLFSYHGLPERHLKKTDPTGSHCLSNSSCCNSPSEAHSTCYRHQVMTTTRLVIDALGLSSDQYTVSFQSRLGKDPWLQPYTDQTLKNLPMQGINKLAVVCPAFVADCLETLEEIGIAGKKTFMDAGGESFELIPCLNDAPDWVDCVGEMVTS
ncbi:ferrochelatase [bacterium]|nr:ferrochelatase [bacterium]